MKIGNVRWDADGSVCCARCGTLLCTERENWKEHALVKRGNASDRLNSGEFGPAFGVYPNEHLEFAEIFCPECKGVLSTEFYLRDEPFRWTFRSLEVAAEQDYDAVADLAENPDKWLSF